MRVNILTSGRFHMLDLARELDSCGFDVKFYSIVPTKRAYKFGLPKQCSKSLAWILSPLIFLVRIAKFKSSKIFLVLVQDFITAFYMRKCDVLIALSGVYVFSSKMAKKRGSIVIVERGSKHMLEQRRILESVPALNKIKRPAINVKRELASYAVADYISIASEHVKDSFLQHNFPEEKLFINPYGVSLRNFYPTNKPIESAYDVIMVGGWSYRKGCDLLIEAIGQLNLSLLHVGGRVDLNFPENANFTHIDSVDETQLISFYKKAKIFALPSREEGLAMVQAQAVACGLPIVCSKNTGGRDLRQFMDDKRWIVEMKETTVECLVECIKEALRLANMQENGKERIYASDELLKSNLSWEAYGKRYTDFLNKVKPV